MRVPALPRLGLGCAPLANLYRRHHRRGGRGHRAAAFDTSAGAATYLDTAPHYGLGLLRGAARPGAGRAGPRVLRAVHQGRAAGCATWGRASRPTAQGFADTPARARVWDFSRGRHPAPPWRGSLDRLGVDHVDIVYLHDVEDHLPEVYATGFPALAELRDAGRGQGHRLRHELQRRHGPAGGRPRRGRGAVRGPLDAAGTLAYDDLLPVCERRGTQVVVGGVYNSGLLADPRPGAHYNYAAAPEDLLRARAADMPQVCAEFGVPLRAAALRFPFAHPAVVSRRRRRRRARGSARQRADVRLRHPRRAVARAGAKGLLDADVPCRAPPGCPRRPRPLSRATRRARVPHAGPTSRPAEEPGAVMRIDAHHHLWDLARRPQPWLDGAGADPIARTFGLAETRPRSSRRTASTPPSSSSPAPRPTRPANCSPSPALRRRIAGVVGWADLADPSSGGSPARRTARWSAIRHQVAGRGRPAVAGPAAGPRAAWPRSRAPGWSTTCWSPRASWPRPLETAEALPELRFVLDHAAKPPIAAGEWEPWAGLLGRSPRCPMSAASCPG